MNKVETRARIIAFHLPQFHPVAENDQWWGRGFTEWTNVSRARPQFPGHDQPRLPGDLGYYDLRVPEAREKQASLARGHGVEAFCYWHYWFGGKRLLGRPVDEILQSGQPDFPFCLAWANESWSRRWLGEERDILIKQTHSHEDDLQHARWLAKVFSDPRYLRVQGRPVFLIYRPGELPEPKRTIAALRAACAAQGLPEPFLLGILAHFHSDCRKLGLDGSVDFEPQLGVLVNSLTEGLKVFEYASERKLMTSRKRTFPFYPCIFVGWDNTPRRGANAIVIKDSTPELFGAGLQEIVEAAQCKPYDDRLVFVNAWNEWAEGNYLEPDRKRGRAFLEVIRDVNCGRGRSASKGRKARLQKTGPSTKEIVGS